MKKILIVILALLNLSLNAQNKANLTKGETVLYINKKVKECEGHYRTPDGSAFSNGVARKMYYRNMKFELSGEKILISSMSSNKSENDYSRDYFERYTTQSFNPSQIVSITNGTANPKEPLGIIIIKLKSNSCATEQNVFYHNGRYFASHDPTVKNSSAEVGLIFLIADPENYNKVKKALEYLRDLYKAEDDPFGK